MDFVLNKNMDMFCFRQTVNKILMGSISLVKIITPATYRILRLCLPRRVHSACDKELLSLILGDRLNAKYQIYFQIILVLFHMLAFILCI